MPFFRLLRAHPPKRSSQKLTSLRTLEQDKLRSPLLPLQEGPDRAAQNGLNASSLTLADFDVGLGEGAGRQKRSSQQHAHGTAAAHRRSSTVLSSGRGRRRHWGQLRPHPRQEAAPHLLVLPSSPSRAGMRSRTAPPCVGCIGAGSSERKAVAVPPRARLLRSLCRPPAGSTPCSCRPATRGNLQHQAEMRWMLQNVSFPRSELCLEINFRFKKKNNNIGLSNFLV